MGLMALDHTRGFLMAFEPAPTDLEATTPALFATRWITHLCAPGFLLLAGVSAFLGGQRMTRAGLAAFLASRGAILIALELTIITFAWIPDPSRSIVLLQVIWAIGASMILMAGLVWLPRAILGAIGLGLMAAHPQLAAAAAALGLPEALVVILFTGGDGLTGPFGETLLVSYAVLPWTGAMAAGYALGPLFLGDPDARRSRLALLGGAAIGLGCLLRLAGLGDPVPWEPGHPRPVLAFLDVEKYPPSPVYLAWTLGLGLWILVVFMRIQDRLGRVAAALLALGRAPLFFYVLHLYALRIVGLGLAALVWGPANLGPPPAPSTPAWPLWSVYAVWAVAMAVLLGPTARFARVKARRGGVLRYF